MIAHNYEHLLNKQLIKQQGLSEAEVFGLCGLHQERLELFQQFNRVKDMSRAEINELVLDLEDLEFIMQGVWKFKEDRNFHTWWYQVNNCSCKAEHQRFGQPRVINTKCFIHGTHETEG